MDKAIDKGNLIDFFAVLLPGMVSLILFIVTNLPNDNINVDKDVMSNIIGLLLFLICSYITGLLLMEFSVILQRLFPSFFDYYRGAIKKDALRNDGVGIFECLSFHFQFPGFREKVYIPKDKNLLKNKINQMLREYDKKEFWLLTNGYADFVERKKAYCMMNRSMAAVPIAYLIAQTFMVHFIKVGNWPACWQMILLVFAGLFFYHRARRQAILIYHEVNILYECAHKKYIEEKKTP